VGTEDHHCAGGHLSEVFDKMGASALQLFNDMPVVNDFVQDENGCPVLIQGAFDNFYRPDDACTEAAGTGKNDSERSVFHE
jgi:hypothetical protein